MCWVLWQRQSNMEWFVRWLDGFESMCVALGYERCCSSDYNYSISPALSLQRNTHATHLPSITATVFEFKSNRPATAGCSFFSSRISEAGAAGSGVAMKQGGVLQQRKRRRRRRWMIAVHGMVYCEEEMEKMNENTPSFIRSSRHEMSTRWSSIEIVPVCVCGLILSHNIWHLWTGEESYRIWWWWCRCTMA